GDAESFAEAVCKGSLREHSNQRHCERSEAIQSRGRDSELLRRFAPRNDDRYSTASCLFCKSVTSIRPGACVIANGNFAAAITACGVTPQAQNTGISSASTGTASP